MKIKIEIKHYLTGAVLFEFEKENNALEDTLIEGIKRGADLRGADLGGANLRGANLDGADLGDAYLRGANLDGAKNVPFIPFSCPSDGAFIGWKKINNYKESYEGSYLVKLGIPEDAKRCSATSYKCRCDKARVLEITRIEDGKNVDIITNTTYVECVYKVGELVIPDSFDENRWNECSNGIHFFINKQQAIDY